MQALFEQMQAEAVPLGEAFLAQYVDLEQAFREGGASHESVAATAGQLGQIEGQLRATHLKYHLLIRSLLTPEQNAMYARLRGYAESGASGQHQPGSQHTHGR